MVSPVTVIGDTAPLRDIPPQFAKYPLIALPPLEAGGVNEMVAWALPAMAVPIVGAPGTVPIMPNERIT